VDAETLYTGIKSEHRHFLNRLVLKQGLKGRPKAQVTDYQPTARNIIEKQRPQLYLGRRLKFHIIYNLFILRTILCKIRKWTKFNFSFIQNEDYTGLTRNLSISCHWRHTIPHFIHIHFTISDTKYLSRLLVCISHKAYKGRLTKTV